MSHIVKRRGNNVITATTFIADMGHIVSYIMWMLFVNLNLWRNSHSGLSIFDASAV